MELAAPTRLNVFNLMTKISDRIEKSKKKDEQKTSIKRTGRTENRRFISPILDTSAQLVTDYPKKSLETLTRRAKAKFITFGLSFPLIDLHSSLEKSYWRTYHCTSEILQDGKKLTAKYCNNRWCIVCNRIRTAKMIEKYYPVIKAEMSDPCFVTLTIPNVGEQRLKQVVSGMILNFQRIKHKLLVRDQVKIKGIRKIEITYNSDRNDFHPHFHVLIENKESARLLQREWLLRYPKAVKDAQDIRPADNSSIIELMKYTTKLVNKNDYSRKDGKIQIKIHAKALDTIFRALYGRRSYQAFGIHLNLNEDISELKSEVYEEITEGVDVWSWDQDQSDWISTYGELLTGCDAKHLYQIVNHCRDC